MKILVTGGAGYAGWSVVHSLASSPEIHEIVIYDNFARRNYGLLLGEKVGSQVRMRTVVDDILNSHELKKAMAGVDCVVHLAAVAPSPFSDENPHTFDQVNHWGTAEVCYAVESVGVPRLVYVSSGAVYGYSDSPLETDATPMPSNAYGRSKLAGERHVLRLGDKLDVAIIRSGTIYGVNPAARFDTFVNRFLLDASLGRTLQVNGSGEQVRPIISVDALASQVRAATLSDDFLGVTHAVGLNISVNQSIDALHQPGDSLNVIYINQQQRLGDLKIAPHRGEGVESDNTREFVERVAADLSALRIVE